MSDEPETQEVAQGVLITATLDPVAAAELKRLGGGHRKNGYILNRLLREARQQQARAEPQQRLIDRNNLLFALLDSWAKEYAWTEGRALGSGAMEESLKVEMLNQVKITAQLVKDLRTLQAQVAELNPGAGGTEDGGSLRDDLAALRAEVEDLRLALAQQGGRDEQRP